MVNKIKDFFRRYWGEIGLVLFVWLIFRGSGDPNFSAGFWQLWLERAFSLSPQHAYLIVFVVRKAGHLAGYGLLALCLKRVRVSACPGFTGRPFLACLERGGVACSDRRDASGFSVYRSGVWYDILLDLLGATVALWAAGQNSFFSRSLYGRKS